MAPLTLLTTKPLFLKPSLSPCPPQNPNPNFAPISLLSSSLSLSLRFPPSPPLSPIRCSGNNDGNFKQEVVTYPKPEAVAWSLALANTVQLIGNVGKPVEIKRLASGNVVAWTRLGVYKSSTETTWVNLTFWNELAHVAYQHVEPGKQIFVSGRLVSDEVKDNENIREYFKVIVKQLNFVQNSSSPVSFYDPRMAQNSPAAVEKRWQAFFANPLDWWDNRRNKKNPNAPDFKHKDTNEALWINSKYIPDWVNSQLEILDSRMASMQDNDRSSTVSFTDMTSL
ncbi:protein OSB1, mitochondrial-like [Carex rostrata]